MKAITRNAPALLLAVFEVIVGILLFRDPVGFTETVVLIFGIVLAVTGIVDLIRYIASKGDETRDNSTLVLGIVTLVVGLFCVIGRGLIIGIFPVLAVLYGILLIVAGVYKLGAWNELRKAGFKAPLALISGSAAILCGLIAVLNPFGTSIAVGRYAAVVLIVEAVIDIVGVFMNTRKRA